MSGRSKTIALSVAALILACGGSSAWAQASPVSPGASIKAAHSAWTDQEYERVVKSTDDALRAPKLTRTQRIEALRLKGAAHAVLGERSLAAKSFERLLTADPRFRMPEGTSPRILAVFEPTRAQWLLARETALRERLGASLAAMKLSVSFPPKAKGGLPLPVSVTLVDPKRLAVEVLVFYRRQGARSYSRLSGATKATRTKLDIPAVFTASNAPYELDVYVEVLHKSGIALLREGSATAPKTLAMTAGRVPRPVPIYKKWWLWAGAAALAIAVPLLIDQAIDVGPQTITGRRN